jgi:mono/diheme cytochrome c family protein
MKKTLLIASVGVVALVIYAALAQNEWTEYITHQKAYRDFLINLDPDTEYPIEMRHLVLPGMKRIDRCVTCHVGMEDPRAADLPHPLKAHPGGYLETHNIQSIGCTSCHDGQGRATSKKEAHANRFAHWEAKRLPKTFIQSTCTRCHSADAPVMKPQYRAGRALFTSQGCLGCHKLNGKGGHLGPDLTELASASTHMKMPRPETRHKLVKKFNGDVNLAYIYESITSPQAQPVESKMFDYDLDEAQAMALTIYLKSLASSKVPDMLQKSGEPVVQPDGGRLFAAYCSACHGPDGMGAQKKELEEIGPAVAHGSFLAIVEPGFLDYKIFYSGSKTMPAWGKAGGLTSEEISRVTGYLLGSKSEPPTLKTVKQTDGLPRFGRVIFNTRCASCHGVDGGYETDLIGPTVTSPEFLSYSSDESLHRMITRGRPGTAMPSWYFLPGRDISDLMAFMREKRGAQADMSTALKQLETTGAERDRIVKWGSARYRGLCKSCHGPDYEGRIGPSLKSPEFLSLASDKFLFDTIVLGREGTAMGRFAHIPGEEIGWLIALLRSKAPAQAKPPRFAEGRVLGSESEGAKIFATGCSQCHGAKGVGHIAPAIGNHNFLRDADDRFIKETASYGRSGTPMLGNIKGSGGTASLSESEINDVTIYLRSLQKQRLQFVGRSLVQGDIWRGRQAFNSSCSKCHGPAGGGDLGPGIGRSGFLSQVDDGFISGMIATGRTGTEMKSFANTLADGDPDEHESDIRSIVRYLRSQADRGKIARKLVIGTPGQGAASYKGNCSQCHGTKSVRGLAPDLMNPVFLRAASDTYMQATMSLGRSGSAMRAMMRGGSGVTEMTSTEVNNIINYLRHTASKPDSNKRK